ncbi:manganese-dependent inorganic pyrophosphatase [Alkalibacterium sp. f15]|uniref:manganese-dependent inorganic pyrophosphatase n=1 Tax=Alkalibacterium sp. f15 TaxID=3414029 RepID=UPI003BF8EC4F
MSKILIFGHQSPDTDAITSAITFSHLQNELGKETEPVALGKTTAETQYALDYFEVEAPRVITTAADETPEVMLVDHNEAQQSVSDIDKVKVLAVVDHHRIANFQTANPLYYRAEPVGCTNTIILKLYKENNVEVPKHIAGLMLSAIISDTLLFKSPTCTAEDEKAAKELAEIADIDIEAYGKDLLKAGADTSSKNADQILNDDAKNFPMGDLTVRIGQVNVVDVDEILERKQELLDEMAAQSESNKLDLFILVTTNVLESDSVALVYGEEKAQVAEAFNKEMKDDTLYLEGVVSRKKQVVPQLTEQFS